MKTMKMTKRRKKRKTRRKGMKATDLRLQMITGEGIGRMRMKKSLRVPRMKRLVKMPQWLLQLLHSTGTDYWILRVSFFGKLCCLDLATGVNTRAFHYF